MELSREKLIDLFGLKELSNITNESYIKTIDLSLFRYEPRSIFLPINEDTKMVKMFEIENYKDIVANPDMLENYLKILLEDNKYTFMSLDNFSFNLSGNKIATKKFTIFINDQTGKVPKYKLLHLASIAIMMITGYLPIPEGYDRIRSIVKQYGEATFEYQQNGYLHILIDKPQKGRLNTARLDTIPKI